MFKIAAVALMIAAPAAADDFASYKANMTPPARYDHPYRGSLRVLHYPTAKVQKVCHGGLACAFVVEGMCDIVLPIRASEGWTEAEMLRHEIAHCNGWSGDHPH